MKGLELDTPNNSTHGAKENKMLGLLLGYKR
jgi:hypothetical protein